MTSIRPSHRVMQAKAFTGHVRVRVRQPDCSWAWIMDTDGRDLFTIEEARAMMRDFEQRNLEVELHPEVPS